MKEVRPREGGERAREYPRPPVVEECDRLIVVRFAREVVVETRRSLRVLERNHPPTYFVSEEDVNRDLLVPSETRSWCEWKGQARWFSLVKGKRVSPDAAFHFPRPLPEYREIAGYIAFFPGRTDACEVDGEKVEPQPGGYNSGWVTSDVIGPFRGVEGFGS